MIFRTNVRTTSPLLAAAAVVCGLWLAGCDEHVQIIRNQDIPILKHQTWAWRPEAPRKEAKRERPVVSRDTVGRRDSVVTESEAANEDVRHELRLAIERQLSAKGLTQVSDAAAADFVVDYHFAMRHHNVTVGRVYPGAYPGLVCGPYGCWEGWGYGPPEVSYENVRFREGTFVFDFYKRGTNRLAYRAIGLEPAHHATFSHEQIDDMVHALLKGLKPKG